MSPCHDLRVGAVFQVRALSILMDLVRAERPGQFAAATFAPALEALLRARKAAPDALAAFVSKYLAYADVRCEFPLLRPKTSRQWNTFL